MTDMTEVKVLMVGPRGAGKSALANYIADAVPNSESPAMAPTQPTKGVRIVEFDRQIPQKKGAPRNIAVELWDVSGDRQYEGGWPAIMHGAVGIVYVYDACKVGEEKDLEQWHKWFGQTIGLKDGQLLVMAHKKEDKKTHRGSLPKSLSNAHVVSTTLEDNQTIIKENFDRFLDEAAKAARQRQKEEEDKLSA